MRNITVPLSKIGGTGYMVKEYIFNQAQKLCKKIYENLPDGIHLHADGNLYLHQTYIDPRNPNNKGLKTIGKI